MKTNNRQYRQGDVAIERIGSLPKKLKKVPLENGRVILAHGEVTGHAHCFAPEDATMLTAENGATYFDVKGRHIDAVLPILRRWKQQVMVRHPNYGLIEFAVVDITIAGENAVIVGDFGLLRHDEHTAHGIPAGTYAGAAADIKTRQREYTPEAIRNVAD